MHRFDRIFLYLVLDTCDVSDRGMYYGVILVQVGFKLLEGVDIGRKNISRLLSAAARADAAAVIVTECGALCLAAYRALFR